MTLAAKGLGKNFGKQWVFRNLNIEISQKESPTTILGKNGSGKTTLLQILAGYLTPSEGYLTHSSKNMINFEPDSIAFVAPYVEIIEEFTLKEFLKFHVTFKKSTKSSLEEIAAAAALPLNKTIADFSTGMKQRVKLLTAFYFQNQYIFMDEPTANLDKEGTKWWEMETSRLSKKNITLIASNHEKETRLSKKNIYL